MGSSPEKILIYELLAHNNVMVVVEALVFREDPAAQQRNLHDAEILRVGGKGYGVVLNGCNWVPASPGS